MRMLDSLDSDTLELNSRTSHKDGIRVPEVAGSNSKTKHQKYRRALTSLEVMIGSVIFSSGPRTGSAPST